MRGSVLQVMLSDQVVIGEHDSLSRATIELKNKLAGQVGSEEYVDGVISWSTFQAEFHPNPQNSMIGTLYGEVHAIVKAAGQEPEESTTAPDLEYAFSDLEDLQEVVFENAYSKGFWDDAPLLEYTDGVKLAYVGNKLALIHSEVSEALEELREKGLDALEGDAARYYGPTGKPEGFGSELADIIIRVLDLAGGYNIPLNEIVAEKIAYNATRPAKHGKAF